MGPMQFLPGTWARYASDGDGDGVADPQNLYDATLAAARYLCSGGLNLRDQSQVLSSILRYNDSMPYAQNVLGWAAAYATGVVPVDLPLLTGPAPPLGDAHLENAEGLGPNLPINMHGLPSTDPLAQMPLIDLSGGPSNGPQPWSAQRPGPACTVICISGDTGPPQQAFNAPPTPAGMPPTPLPAAPPVQPPAAPPVAPPAALPAQVPPPAAPAVPAPPAAPPVAPPPPAPASPTSAPAPAAPAAPQSAPPA
jgi:Transglycosylase SLT domain